ncbi:hypothetical protein chiPu_0028022, partial [Chiloscyllium punctatum]|nr:hypothetical protein [Chiloscyllium punctatum]
IGLGWEWRGKAAGEGPISRWEPRSRVSNSDRAGTRSRGPVARERGERLILPGTYTRLFLSSFSGTRR